MDSLGREYAKMAKKFILVDANPLKSFRSQKLKPIEGVLHFEVL